MNTVDLTAGRVAYRDAGAGEPVVLLHGIFTAGNLWRKVVPLLEPDVRCVVPELPLGSHSIPVRRDADLSAHGLAELVAELIEELGLERPTVVGNDTGGAIAQVLATRHPERVGRLVLTPCDCFDRFFPPLFRPLQIGARVPWLLRAAVQPLRLRPARRLPVAYGWLTKRPIDPPEVEAEWVRPFLEEADIRHDAISFLRGVDPRYTLEAASKLHLFRKPTLVAWATEDRVFPFSCGQRLAGLVEGARLESIDDSYTYVSEDRPERVAELVRAFVDGTEAR